MTAGAGLAILGGCVVLAAALIAAAWVAVNDRRERLRAIDRLGPPAAWDSRTKVTKRVAR